MIVCVCKAICEKEIELLVASGVSTPEAIERHCGAGGDCGTCRPDIEHVIESVATRASARSLPVIQPNAPSERAA